MITTLKVVGRKVGEDRGLFNLGPGKRNQGGKRAVPVRERSAREISEEHQGQTGEGREVGKL